MKGRYFYWISTTLLCLLYLTSAFLYLTKSDFVHQSFNVLGYPGYLVTILIAVKILAVIAILSRFSVAISDLAYAGMFFHLLLAFSAHLNVNQNIAAIPAIVGLVLLVTSFFTQNTARAKKSPYFRSVANQHS